MTKKVKIESESHRIDPVVQDETFHDEAEQVAAANDGYSDDPPLVQNVTQAVLEYIVANSSRTVWNPDLTWEEMGLPLSKRGAVNSAFSSIWKKGPTNAFVRITDKRPHSYRVADLYRLEEWLISRTGPDGKVRKSRIVDNSPAKWRNLIGEQGFCAPNIAKMKVVITTVSGENQIAQLGTSIGASLVSYALLLEKAFDMKDILQHIPDELFSAEVARRLAVARHK